MNDTMQANETDASTDAADTDNSTDATDTDTSTDATDTDTSTDAANDDIDMDVDLKVEEDPLAFCKDKSNTGFSIGGVRAECSMLKFLCNSTKYNKRITKACPRTCSACSKIENSAINTKCEDMANTGLTIDGMPATCDILAPLCNVTPSSFHTKDTLRKIQGTCPKTCGVDC